MFIARIAYEYAIGRLKERSTWAAIFTSGAAYLGVRFTAGQVHSLDSLGLALVAAVVALVPDGKFGNDKHPPLT